jgi:DNA-binding MarR family transcriptional regulator
VPDPGDFDAVLLSPARLGIVSVLLARREASFADLKALLDLTQGNLGAHLGTLEEAGYVEVEKSFVDKRPRTTVRLTRAGRAAFHAHLAHLERIAREARAAR